MQSIGNCCFPLGDAALADVDLELVRFEMPEEEEHVHDRLKAWRIPHLHIDSTRRIGLFDPQAAGDGLMYVPMGLDFDGIEGPPPPMAKGRYRLRGRRPLWPFALSGISWIVPLLLWGVHESAAITVLFGVVLVHFMLLYTYWRFWFDEQTHGPRWGRRPGPREVGPRRGD